MFADNQILKELDLVSDSKSLYGFLNKRSKYILPILDNVIARIGNLSNTLDYCADILDLLFFNKEQLLGYEYFILKQYIYSIDKSRIPITTMTKRERNLYLLLCNNDMIREWNDWPSTCDPDAVLSTNDKWKMYQIDFLHDIFDIYIPSHESTSTSNDVVSKGYGLSYMINHKDELNKYVFSYAESIRLANYIHDIYAHDEIKSNAFVDMHGLNVITSNFMEKVYNVAERYKKFFLPNQYNKSEDLVINEIYAMFTTLSDTNLPREILVNQIKTLKTKYLSTGGTNLNIVFYFLRDVLDAAGNLIDTYHYNEYLSIITDTVKNDLPEEENKENLTANESINGLTIQDDFVYAMEAYKKNSVQVHDTEGKFYKAFKNYKNNQDKIDSQLNKAIEWGKKLLIGDVKSEVIEGKKFNAMGLLRTALTTAAIFSVNAVAGIIAIVIKYSLKKSTTISERKKIAMELEEEIEIVNEKIDDARSDGDREAKYAMMRTRNELQNALRRVKYGLEADQRSVGTAKNSINLIRGGGKLN